MSPPADVLSARARIGALYLTGAGVEIGALNAPTPLPAGATVRYVDRLPVDELRQQYRELGDDAMVPIDVVDDGERLGSIPDASLDFLVANHMLEHCENPLGTLRTHLRKVKPGGFLFYAIPEARSGCEDATRPRTPFRHLVDDDADDGRRSRFEHYVEWAKHVNGILEDEMACENANANLANRYSIHFHVWDANGWLDFLARARTYLDGAFDVWHVELVGAEVVSVLRRAPSKTVPDGVREAFAVPPDERIGSPQSIDEGTTPGAQVSTRLRAMLGPFRWSLDDARIEGGMLHVSGWLYARDDDPASVLFTVNGKPFDERSIDVGGRRDLAKPLWFVPTARRAAFRLRTRVDDDLDRASVLRVSARWSAADDAWRDRHDHHLPGPVAADARLAMPSAERIVRVAGPITAAHFRRLGCNAYETLRVTAARHGVDLTAPIDVLDWGVGCGRTARFCQGNARLVGCDIDADNIDWCRANLPGRFETISPEPPTAWPDACFDAIFGISVISHLTDASRHAWYGELRRLARPGALVMLTLLGDDAIATASVDAATLAYIERHGSCFFASEETIDKLLGNRAIYGTTYQSSRAAVAEAARWFEVLELVPGGMNNHQDLLVLRRPADDGAAPYAATPTPAQVPDAPAAGASGGPIPAPAPRSERSVDADTPPIVASAPDGARKGTMSPNYRDLYESHAQQGVASIGDGDFESVGRVELAVLKFEGLRADSKLLDFGCGVGRLALQAIPYLSRGYYVGLDIAPTMIERARELAREHLPDLAPERYRFGVNDGESLASWGANFDMISAYSVFTHMESEDTYRYMVELAKLLVTGGKLVCSVLPIEIPFARQLFVKEAELPFAERWNRVRNIMTSIPTMEHIATMAGFRNFRWYPGNQMNIRLDDGALASLGQSVLVGMKA